MIIDYIRSAMEQARYEIIKDREPYYGEIPVLKGVWATGKTLEECRRKLEETVEGGIIVRLQRRLSLPPVRKKSISGHRKTYRLAAN
ncbi:MAG: hypothetical protein A2Z34_02735 [Planctomycetes bacterium RBG_16_59_8]|nr:MAG: hypothetical protein A2Z34_02735 [Planctomycetes bacterium RBG_16_59_8]